MNTRLSKAGSITAMSVLLLLSLIVSAYYWPRYNTPRPWTAQETGTLASLWLENLALLPADPSNLVADDPRAASLGQRLFFDKRLSANGEVACATCHQPRRSFTDGLPVARALGQSQRNTPGIVGTAYSPWLYWDGRKDSQWSQALSPLEDPAEHGGNRMYFARLVSSDPAYHKDYLDLFGPPPDFSDHGRFPEHAGPLDNSDWRQNWQAMSSADRQQVNEVFANIGKLIAAYERRLMPGPSRFDAYVEAILAGNNGRAQSLFSRDEIRGLRLFIGEARCTECHNGPLFTNNEFHNTGLLPPAGQLPDRGRSGAVEQLRSDPFNCLGQYSDADPDQCLELTYMRTGPELIGAMRTPSLRNLEHTAPYMHKGQMQTLTEVLRHYNEAPLALIGHNEAEPLDLGNRELQQIEAFLDTLAAPLATAGHWLQAPEP
ncbi:MAG: cytochrome c peroxidase [Pseudohongiellaceae bacterium]